MKLPNADERKPYPEMKDSGVPWLGEVPAHWEVLPLCAVATPKSISGQQHRELLSVYLDRGVIRFSEVEEKRTNVTSEDLSKYQAVDPGDFVLNNQQAWRGSVGVSNLSGIVSPAYLVLSLNPRLHSGFANLLFRERVMVSQYLACSRGVGSIQRNLYWPHLKRVVFPSPPLPEQTAIVRFLAHADRRIRRYIRAKQKLIALLEEQKQAIIHQAVTGQIDVRTGEPYPAYKPSGLEWLGQIPEHWQVQRSKRVFKPRKELARQNDVQLSATQAYGVITQEDYEERVGRKVVKILRHLEKRRHVEIDDFVISMRSFQGGLERAWASGCIRSSYIVLQPARKLAVGYFSYLFKSAGYINALQSTANFIRDGQDLNFENFCQVDLPFPPMAEQQRIGQTLDRIIADIGSAIEQSRRQIDSFGEYRTRLIADVVTGKLDVREAAAELPEEDVPGDAEESAEEYTIEEEVTV